MHNFKISLLDSVFEDLNRRLAVISCRCILTLITKRSKKGNNQVGSEVFISVQYLRRTLYECSSYGSVVDSCFSVRRSMC
jgi:hypothetical protein